MIWNCLDFPNHPGLRFLSEVGVQLNVSANFPGLWGAGGLWGEDGRIGEYEDGDRYSPNSIMQSC